MNDFWHTLARPFFVLAPMEDVTDAAFRRLIASYGKPHVMFTEFTSADGLVLAPEEGKKSLLKKLLFSPDERPIVAQLFSAYPERMEAAARLVRELGFDGIDINMGCPDKAIEKGRCGSGMIKHPELAREIIRAAKQCRRSSLPELLPPAPLDKFLASPVMAQADVAVCFDTLAGQAAPVDGTPQKVIVLIGPEGGFSQPERAKLEGKAHPWLLGGRVLRAETAVLAGLTAAQLRWGDFR